MHSEKSWVNCRGLMGHCDLPPYPKRIYVTKRVNFLQGAEVPMASSALRFIQATSPLPSHL